MKPRLVAALLFSLLPVVNGCTNGQPPNFLILIADDLGVEKVGAYGESDTAPPTPQIDRLARDGVLFRHAYASPTCTPSRVALLTGRHPRRFGLGTRIRARRESWQLPTEEIALPEIVDRSGSDYATSAIGKWHLNTYQSDSALSHPLDTGFDWYAGSVANLIITREFRTRGNYMHWEKNRNGELSWSNTYATSDTVDDALERISDMEPPWLLWVAFNAPHSPFHEPPAHLHTRPQVDTQRQKLDAMIEALDTEIGRLLRGIPSEVRADTVVVFVGDNGTATAVSERGERAKNTVYEDGVRVPLVISGPGVTQGAEVDALVDVTDIYATLAELAGVATERMPPVLDGISLAPYLKDPSHPPRRDTVYGEVFEPNGPPPYSREDRMIRDARYKLIQKAGEEALLFDLRDRNFEGEPIDSAGESEETRVVRQRLQQQLEQKTQELSAPPP